MIDNGWIGVSLSACFELDGKMEPVSLLSAGFERIVILEEIVYMETHVRREKCENNIDHGVESVDRAWVICSGS